MIHEARTRSQLAAVEADFALGDAHALDLPADSFDACRADRVLQHVAYPAKVIAEMSRITRPGGRMVVAEPDWGTFVIDSQDQNITTSILAVDAAARDALIGRQLPASVA